MSFALIANVAAGGSGNSVTTANIDTSSADLLIAFICSYAGGGTPVPTLTDSKGNTWTALTSRTDANNTVKLQTFWCTPTSKGSGHNFTSNGTGVYTSISVVAFSGSAASPFDSENGSNSTATPGSITPSQANCLVVTGTAAEAVTAYSINAGFTIPSGASIAWAAGNHEGVSCAYLIQTSAAAANPTWTATSQDAISSEIAVFKAASASSGPTYPQLERGIRGLNRGLAGEQ